MTESRRLNVGLTCVTAIALGLSTLSALAQEQSSTGSPADRKVGYWPDEEIAGCLGENLLRFYGDVWK